MTLEESDKRLAGYRKLCMFGIGSMFWGAVTGVLDHLQKKKPEWVHHCTIYFAISLVIILNGLSAAYFPKSAPLALFTSGLGAWTAFIFVLATFHIASLQFHAQLNEWLQSMAICATIVTYYWGWTAQDPLIIHVLSKLVTWLIGLAVCGVGLILYAVIYIMLWLIRCFWRLCTLCCSSLQDCLVSHNARVRPPPLGFRV
uniref:Uncharacterized protein n=1 Tax=Arundo donax TaxID=35708 RepID=A0A0A9HFJ4_ARUDO